MNMKDMKNMKMGNQNKKAKPNKTP